MRGWATVAAIGLLLAGSAASAEALVVSAAASLTQAFRDIGRDFEAAHRGVSVVFNFAASDVLLAQIAKGAPADVFASADEAAMNRGEKNELITPGTRRDFAANTLVVVVPRPAAPVATLAMLAEPRFKRIALGSPQTVPAGRYAKEALERIHLWATLEPRLVFTQNVRQALDYVAREEADAGFVYATDASILSEKVKVAFEVTTPTPVRYPIAVVRDSRQPALAAAIVGVAAGWLLAKARFPGRDIVDALLLLPMVMPPTVLGYYLLVAFGRKSAFGHWLEANLGIQLVFTWQGATIAAAVVAFPLVFKAARTAFEGIHPDLENAGRTLGYREWTLFTRITFPLAWRGIAAGSMLAFARAMGEFGATLMIAGNIPGRTQTLSIAIYEAVHAGDDALANSLVLIASVVCIVLLVAASRVVRRGHLKVEPL